MGDEFPWRKRVVMRPPDLMAAFRKDHGVNVLVRLKAAQVRAATPEHERPRRRSDCLEGGMNAERPCPFAGCRHHLGLYVTACGSLVVADGWEDDGGPSCALDVVDANPEGVALERVGELHGVTRERLRQIETKALAKVKATTEET